MILSRACAALPLALLLLPGSASADGGAERYVLAWPPTRYARAEVVVFRADDDLAPLDVRVVGRGIDLTVAVPVGGAARVALPPEARCAPGVDACALVVERVAGSGAVHVVLQSPDTAGAADTLLLTAHDTVRVPPPSACARSAVVVALPNASPDQFPETLAFASVVPVAGAAVVSASSGCSDVTGVVLALPDVLTLTCSGESADLTGTRVEADAPVLVLSGNAVTTVPVDPTAGLSADLALDAPLPSTPTTTLVVPPLPRAPAFAGLGDLVRLVAAEDLVARVRDGSARDESRALAAGQAWDVDTAHPAGDLTLRVDADGHLHAWHVLASRARRGIGDVAALAAVPRELFTTRDRFFLPDGYAEANALAVVAEAGAQVLLDGAPLSGFSAAPGGDLAWAVVALPLPPSGPGAVHEISGDRPFGAWVVGMGGFKAHGCVAAVGWPGAPPAGTTVLRGEVADSLAVVARATDRAWRDDVPAPRAYYRVDDATADLRVVRCGGSACLSW